MKVVTAPEKSSYRKSEYFSVFLAGAIDMGKAILDNVIAMKGPEYSKILSIEVDIFTDNVQLKSTIAMIPNQNGLDRLMTQLFSEGWAQG